MDPTALGLAALGLRSDAHDEEPRIVRLMLGSEPMHRVPKFGEESELGMGELRRRERSGLPPERDSPEGRSGESEPSRMAELRSDGEGSGELEPSLMAELRSRASTVPFAPVEFLRSGLPLGDVEDRESEALKAGSRSRESSGLPLFDFGERGGGALAATGELGELRSSDGRLSSRPFQ